MTTLRDFLIKKGYTKVKITLTKTNHFEVSVMLNGINGQFILDTGASSSCVGFEAVATFGLDAKESAVKASGAGATEMPTGISKKNTIKIGKWKKEKVTLVLFDLSHVNTALASHNAKTVDGIIGADLLKKGKAVIDYDKRNLYLKP